MKRILITGADGMLGLTLQDFLKDYILFTPPFPQFDITKPETVEAAFAEAKPDIVINCAAKTDVDGCEDDEWEALDINSEGARNVARVAAREGARMIHISTDYVFDGLSKRPYVETDRPNPKTAYGKSKWEGEDHVKAICRDYAIIRTGWLYGPRRPNFVRTMLNLGQQEGEPLKVVNDQRGNPTSTEALAVTIEQIMNSRYNTTFHCTCEGDATWYEFACAIMQEAGLPREIVACTTDEYPRPAPRPANSRLFNRALALGGLGEMPHWRDALNDFIGEYFGSTNAK